MNLLERMIMFLSPSWAQSRARARFGARHFEAAAVGRRTDGWPRKLTDANAAASGQSLAYLRAQARDDVRNNPWARRGLRRLAVGTIGWGIRPKAKGRGAKRIKDLWKLWAETTQCDAAGRLTMYGLQRLVMRTVVESGECLIRRRMRLPTDGLAIPMQLQVLEPDYIDTSKDGIKGQAGGDIIQGIEFDAIGRRVAYWLFDQHPGGRSLGTLVSKRVPADGVLHVYDQERAGQVRGVSWFASVDVRLHEFDTFEDATLVKQKIAACLTAFVTDIGDGITSLGTPKESKGQLVDSMEPGMVVNLPAGKDVKIANPPTASDHQSFSTTALRGIAAGLGTTYEDLSGDWSQSNYSSARMGRNGFVADVHDWRWNMIIPQFCVPVWDWMIAVLQLAGEDVEAAPAKWTPAPLPMLDPDKDSSATTKQVRAGQMTHDEMLNELGHDPDEFWEEYAEGLKRIDQYGIILDSDARKTSTGGQMQSKPANAGEAATTKPKPGQEADAADQGDDDERYYEQIEIRLTKLEVAVAKSADPAEA